MRQQIKLYNAEGITFRSGVPDGWRGKKKLINEIKAQSDAEAKVIVDNMIDEKVFEPDCKEARLAMETAVSIMVAQKYTPENQPVPLYNADARLKAIKTILEYAQRKPVTSSQVAVSGAEAWLAELAQKSE